MSKASTSIMILILALLSVQFFEVASAQTILKPSVPEFTIQTQSQANTTIIILTIRNQPFNATSHYPDEFFYNVAISVDGKNWNGLYHVEDAEDWYPEQSKSSTTVLRYVAGETTYYPMNSNLGVDTIPMSGEVAFKVQAMIGHRDRGEFQNGFMPYVLVGEESDWSNSQIINIPAGSIVTYTPIQTSQTTSTLTSHITQNPTSNFSGRVVLLLGIFVAVVLAVAILAVILAVFLIRINRK